MTNQSSCLDEDNLPKYGEKKPKFSGKRVTRGFYKTRENKLLNADVNGSLNIIKKVIPLGIKGWQFNPVATEPTNN